MSSKYGFESVEEKRNRLELEKQERIAKEEARRAALRPRLEAFVQANDALVSDIFEDWLIAHDGSDFEVVLNGASWSTQAKDSTVPRMVSYFTGPVRSISAVLESADSSPHFVVHFKYLYDDPPDSVKELAQVLRRETGESVEISKIPPSDIDIWGFKDYGL